MPLSFLSRKYTITNSGSPLEANDLIFTDIDFQVQTKAVDYGDQNSQDFALAINDILSYRTSIGVNLKDIFFKNHVADEIGYIVVAGILKQ